MKGGAAGTGRERGKGWGRDGKGKGEREREETGWLGRLAVGDGGRERRGSRGRNGEQWRGSKEGGERLEEWSGAGRACSEQVCSVTGWTRGAPCQIDLDERYVLEEQTYAWPLMFVSPHQTLLKLECLVDLFGRIVSADWREDFVELDCDLPNEFTRYDVLISHCYN